MEAASGLDDGSCMPGLGSVAPGGAGGRRWSWWHHPACRRRALGFLADDLVSAERYQQIVATTEPRAGHTQWVSVSVPGSCLMTTRDLPVPYTRCKTRGRPRRRAFNLLCGQMCQLLTQLASETPRLAAAVDGK